MRVKERAKVYTAIQYDGFNNEELREFLGDKILMTKNGKALVDDKFISPSDWVVADITGNHYVYTDKEFIKKYEGASK